MTAAEWNAKYPVGQAVNYHPLIKATADLLFRDTPNGFERTKTRSEAWTLPGGQHVVMIEGRAGGVSLDHIVVTA